jgi:hypothetical protein
VLRAVAAGIRITERAFCGGPVDHVAASLTDSRRFVAKGAAGPRVSARVAHPHERIPEPSARFALHPPQRRAGVDRELVDDLEAEPPIVRKVRFLLRLELGGHSDVIGASQHRPQQRRADTTPLISRVGTEGC